MDSHKYFAYKQYFYLWVSAAMRTHQKFVRHLGFRSSSGGQPSFTERIGPNKATPPPKPFSRSTQFLFCRSGTSAIEFAIIAPVFILLVFGMIAYGIYFGAMHSVQQIAADAARTAIAGLDETERKTLAQRFIDLNANGYVFIDGSKLAVSVKDSEADAEQFVVTLRYDAAQLPIWNLLPIVPLPEKTIVRSSTIRVGGI